MEVANPFLVLQEPPFRIPMKEEDEPEDEELPEPLFELEFPFPPVDGQVQVSSGLL